MAEINANGTGISTYHLADTPRLYEPSRNNTFEFLIHDIDSLIAPGIANAVATDDDWIDAV